MIAELIGCRERVPVQKDTGNCDFHPVDGTFIHAQMDTVGGVEIRCDHNACGGRRDSLSGVFHIV